MASIRKRGDYQFQARVSHKGFPPQSKTFTSRAEAEAWVRAIESERDRGIFVSRVEAEKTTLADALPYLEVSKLRLREMFAAVI